MVQTQHQLKQAKLYCPLSTTTLLYFLAPSRTENSQTREEPHMWETSKIPYTIFNISEF